MIHYTKTHKHACDKSYVYFSILSVDGSYLLFKLVVTWLNKLMYTEKGK